MLSLSFWKNSSKSSSCIENIANCRMAFHHNLAQWISDHIVHQSEEWPVTLGTGMTSWRFNDGMVTNVECSLVTQKNVHPTTVWMYQSREMAGSQQLWHSANYRQWVVVKASLAQLFFRLKRIQLQSVSDTPFDLIIAHHCRHYEQQFR